MGMRQFGLGLAVERAVIQIVAQEAVFVAFDGHSPGAFQPKFGS